MTTEWQYEVVEWGGTNTASGLPGRKGLQELLDGLGRDGWDLTATVPQGPNVLLIFKRP